MHFVGTIVYICLFMFIQVFVADYIGESWEHLGRCQFTRLKLFSFPYVTIFWIDNGRLLEEFNTLGGVRPESNDILPDAL